MSYNAVKSNSKATVGGRGQGLHLKRIWIRKCEEIPNVKPGNGLITYLMKGYGRGGVVYVKAIEFKY